MNNIILEKIARLFLRIVAIVSIFLLLRGHNSPGGGFIGGIVLAVGFIFYGIIFGSENIKKSIRLDTSVWIGIGLVLIFTAAIVPAFSGLAPLTGLWYTGSLPLLGTLHIGTPLLFDTGIFIAVTGVILSIVISTMEVLKWNS
jgi:multisubunit Na+/H+ antiporter MnhB subunit